MLTCRITDKHVIYLTGGVNTAGMGGIGGPYRLDSGGPVYQVPDIDKDSVPEEVCIIQLLTFKEVNTAEVNIHDIAQPLDHNIIKNMGSIIVLLYGTIIWNKNNNTGTLVHILWM